MTKEFNFDQLMQKPVAMMTGEELYFLLDNSRGTQNDDNAQVVQPKRMFYGIEGIAQVFGCSVPTANRIKKSGVINEAITQMGRKIVIDGDKALALVKANGGCRTENKS